MLLLVFLFFGTINNGEFNMRIFKIAIGIVLLFGLVACENMRGRDIGTVTGAGAGALIGNSLGGGAVGTVGGAVVGGVAGHYVGKSMEKK